MVCFKKTHQLFIWVPSSSCGFQTSRSCLLQPFFQVFIYKFACLLQDRLIWFHIYQTWSYVIIFVRTFECYFQKLNNMVRLFSAYRNKETHEKLLCHAWKFYLGASSILLVTSQEQYSNWGYRDSFILFMKNILNVKNTNKST